MFAGFEGRLMDNFRHEMYELKKEIRTEFGVNEKEIAQIELDSEILFHGQDAIASQMISQEIWNRKWSILISGLEGASGERPQITRRKVLETFCPILNVPKPMLAACHRLAKGENSTVIVRFLDLDDRDEWVRNASKIGRHNRDTGKKYAISPNLPPILTEARRSVFRKRATLSVQDKMNSKIVYLQQYPYILCLTKLQTGNILPDQSRTEIIEAYLHLTGKNDVVAVKEKSPTPEFPTQNLQNVEPKPDDG